MKKLFALSLLIWPVSIAFAQNNLPPVYEIRTDTAYTSIPDSCWQMLEDVNGKWTINEVNQSPLGEKFHSNTGINSSVTTYWVRYRIKNDMVHEAKISFSSNLAAYFDIFIKQADSTWKHKKTGYFLPWSERDGSKEWREIPFIVNPAEEVMVYQRMKFELKLYPQKDINVSLRSTEKVIHNDTIYYYKTKYFKGLREALNFGICILAAIFCFFFFLTTYERVYFQAAMMDLSIALFYSMDPFTDIFFGEYPWVREYGYPVVIGFFLYFITSTFRYAFNTKHLFPRLNRLLFTLGILPFLLLLVVFTFSKLPFTAYFVLPFSSTLIFLSIFIACLLVMRKRNRTARLLIAGVLMYSLYNILSLSAVILNISLPAWFQDNETNIEVIGNLCLIVVSTWILFERYRQLQVKLSREAFEKEQIAKEKEIERRQLIEQQKIELEKTVEERTAELKQSLEELKSTQSQLIQSEKMASLGELTAGIAHEIQNPLNFVNNFSEVNKELVDELQQELKAGKIEDAIVISNDIKDNEEKINHHGRRADAIVKGMLQHSRTSSGQKEMTDINGLADEYLRLSYHGLRAKDKSFNVEIKTDFDSSIGKININPQDIGRVLLNLFNNAFYTVNEKKLAQNGAFESVVNVSSKKENGNVAIKVEDNGNGIPQKVLEKIFHPFFTTKPTGQGTGLGLSLAYDIVKAHGGEIKVETKEGEGSQFIIQLPDA
jgi:signal transduction histidine kinase